MARPRKPREVDGTLLADNLYTDPKKRHGYWRYVRPDGSSRTFQAKTVAEANRIAESNNVRRNEPRYTGAGNPARDSLLYHIPEYVKYREKQDPKLKAKQSWQNRKGLLYGFAKTMDLPLNMIERDVIKTWWETLTYHQQKARHAEFRRLFNWLMSEHVVQLPYNPFTTSDDMPRLYVTGEPEKARMRLTRDEFWTLYQCAGEIGYPALQIAMGLSLTTFMRESDLCALRLDENVQSNMLRRVIGKSLAQRDTASAARLKWDLGNHELVKQLLAKAREESLKNRACPFVISHWPKAKRISKLKEHHAQVLPRRLIEMFAETRSASGLYKQLPPDRSPPTFHEIRSLASALATEAGYELGSVQQAMAHESSDTTLLYQNEHQLPYSTVDVVLTESAIGGSFE